MTLNDPVYLSAWHDAAYIVAAHHDLDSIDFINQKWYNFEELSSLGETF